MEWDRSSRHTSSPVEAGRTASCAPDAMSQPIEQLPVLHCEASDSGSHRAPHHQTLPARSETSLSRRAEGSGSLAQSWLREGSETRRDFGVS